MALGNLLLLLARARRSCCLQSGRNAFSPKMTEGSIGVLACPAFGGLWEFFLFPPPSLQALMTCKVVGENPSRQIAGTKTFVCVRVLAKNIPGAPTNSTLQVARKERAQRERNKHLRFSATLYRLTIVEAQDERPLLMNRYSECGHTGDKKIEDGGGQPQRS